MAKYPHIEKTSKETCIMSKFIFCLFIFIGTAVITLSPYGLAFAETCEAVVIRLNSSLASPVDEEELVMILRTLNETGKLPSKFITKRQAQKFGWRPGKELWLNDKLMGKSIGGDVFANRGGRLPNGRRKWREADLNYKGKRRGAQRIVYSNDGLRMITVDHYKTFREIEACK